jgi:hypothetical protein
MIAGLAIVLLLSLAFLAPDDARARQVPGCPLGEAPSVGGLDASERSFEAVLARAGELSGCVRSGLRRSTSAAEGEP